MQTSRSQSRTCSKCHNPPRPGQAYCRFHHAESIRLWRAKRGGRSNYLSPQARAKANARSYAKVYLKRGKLTKSPCANCGNHTTEMHHPDYSRPLHIVWLCEKCHDMEHVSHSPLK